LNGTVALDQTAKVVLGKGVVVPFVVHMVGGLAVIMTAGLRLFLSYVGFFLRPG
jgi:hypothetical protein